MISNDQIMTIDEVSKYLKISKPTIYRKVRAGIIPAKKVGRSWRFLLSDIRGLVEEKKGPPSIEEGEIHLLFDIEELKKICRAHYIALCYLFGSMSVGENDEASDLDIGVVFLPSVNLEESSQKFEAVKIDFERITEGKKIDLIFLQKVGPLVREQAIMGKCFYSVSDFFKTRYEDIVSSEAMDFRFFQERFDKEMLDEIKKGGFFVA